jgi:hypothetical protein
MAAIKVMPWGKNQGDYVLIDESDFDPKKHKKFVEVDESATKESEEKAKKEAEEKATKEAENKKVGK